MGSVENVKEVDPLVMGLEIDRYDGSGIGRKRGGSWINNPRNCRSAYRNRNQPSNRNNNIGFRVACVAPSTLLGQNWQV